MPTINASSMRASLGDLLTAHPPAASRDPAGFASLLRQTQNTPPPAAAPMPPTAAAPKPAAQEPAPASESARETDAPRDAETASRTRAQPRSKPRAHDPAPDLPREQPRLPDTRDAVIAVPAEASDEAVDALPTPTPATAPEPTAIDPGTMQWLAALQRVVSGQTDDVERDAGAKALPADADAPPDEARGVAKGQRPTDLAAETDLKDKAAHGRAQLADAASARQFAGVLAEQRRAEAPAQPQTFAVDRTHDTPAANAAALAPAPSAGSAAAPPPGIPIAAPVHAPDFAQELGLRLAVLAKDGVQTAELHLNPAEMGPVSVQIVMDGTQARVDFGADMAATRQAIEAGLPELASALADAGFTLAGGGVSQHAGGRSGGHTPASPQGERARGMVVEDEVKRVAVAAQRVVARGGVDLFV